MFNVVGDVSKESSARLYSIDVLERFIDTQMCRVFSESQTIKHQHIQVLQCIDRDFRNIAEICQVSKIVETISHHRQTAVNHFQRRDQQLISDTKTRTRRDNVCEHFW